MAFTEIKPIIETPNHQYMEDPLILFESLHQ